MNFKAWLAVQLLKHVSYELFGKERAPQTKPEQVELTDRIKALLKRCALLTFKPPNWKDDPHPKQGWFIRSHEAQIRAFIAANQVGKTWGIAAELISWCLGFYPWNMKPVVFPGGRKWRQGMRFGLGGKDFINALSEDILPKMNALLPLKEMGCEFEKIQGRVTSKISFPPPFYSSIKLMSYEMEPPKWEGYTWDGFAFNEPPPRYAFIATKRGMMKEGAPLLFALTPIEEPYIKEEIYDAPNAVHITRESDLGKLTQESIAVVTCDLADTPYISQQQKDLFVAGLDEDEIEARQHGRFLHLMGRVYKNFQRSIEVEIDGKKRFVQHHVLNAHKWIDEDGKEQPGWYDLHPEWMKYPAFCVLDPHDRKPFAIGWGVVTPRNEKVFLCEWPDFDITKIRSYKATMDEYCEIINGVEDELWKTTTEGMVYGFGRRPSPVVWRIMDPNFGRAKKATTGTSVEDEFAERGLYFDTSVDDDIQSGHIAVRNAFGNEELFYLETCKNIIKATENYTWEEYRGKTDHSPKEKPRDKYKDFMDVVRYAIKSELRFFQPGALDRLLRPAGMRGGPR
jgi:hypothetical protein